MTGSRREHGGGAVSSVRDEIQQVTHGSKLSPSNGLLTQTLLPFLNGPK